MPNFIDFITNGLQDAGIAPSEDFSSEYQQEIRHLMEWKLFTAERWYRIDREPGSGATPEQLDHSDQQLAYAAALFGAAHLRDPEARARGYERAEQVRTA